MYGCTNIKFRQIYIYNGITDVSEKCPDSTQVPEAVTDKVLC